jgi:hypothetical protein
MAQIHGVHITAEKSFVLILAKYCLGFILGHSFTQASCHPVDEYKVQGGKKQVDDKMKLSEKQIKFGFASKSGNIRNPFFHRRYLALADCIDPVW